VNSADEKTSQERSGRRSVANANVEIAGATRTH